jgi:hypothetical protein
MHCTSAATWSKKSTSMHYGFHCTQIPVQFRGLTFKKGWLGSKYIGVVFGGRQSMRIQLSQHPIRTERIPGVSIIFALTADSPPVTQRTDRHRSASDAQHSRVFMHTPESCWHCVCT